jgi:hypothetical protein
MRRILATLFIAAACASPAPGTGSPTERSTTDTLALYVTGSQNGADLVAVDPLTLQDRSAQPLLPIVRTGANNTSTIASLDGSAIVVTTYNYRSPAVARDLDITVFDALTGTRRAQFNPEVAVTVDTISPDGARIYARQWPPRDSTAERIVLDATNGRILEREPQLVIVGHTIALANDERVRRQYRLVGPTLLDATAPQPVDLAGWDLRTGKELWRLNIPSLLVGEWKTGRIIDAVEVRSRLVPAVTLSPDGRRIAVVRAFGCCGSRRTVWLIDASTGTLLSERTHGLVGSFLDQLFAPSIAMAKSLDESVVVDASFSADGRVLYAYSHSSRIDDRGEAKHQYFGMVAASLHDAAIRGHDIKMESYWYNNRIGWIRASPDGKWLYVFLEHSGGVDRDGGHFLRRLDSSTLRVLAERRFDGYRQAFLLASR